VLEEDIFDGVSVAVEEAVGCSYVVEVGEDELQILFAFLGGPFLNASRKPRRKKGISLNFSWALKSLTSQLELENNGLQSKIPRSQDPKIPFISQYYFHLNPHILPIFQKVSTRECEIKRRIRNGVSQTAAEMFSPARKADWK
jgi:hypothetical protein